MEGAAYPAEPTPARPVDDHLTTGVEPGQKGLKANAIGFVSSVVIGVASVAPGYSMAATLGLVAAAVGFQSPAIMLAAFVPMLCIAFAYRYLNQADPDAGTTFAWVTRAMGPRLGWMNGWVIVVADVVVMASLAQIAGLYTFQLVGWHAAANSTAAVTAAGVVWIAIMTAIVYIGIELSARTQRILLAAELAILAVFSVVAIVKVYASHPAGAVHPHLSWFSPFATGSWSAFVSGVLLAVFIYWGWDSGVAVNEETKDRHHAPGRAAVIATLVLLVTYVLIAVAGQAYHGSKFLVDNSDDVLSALGKDVFGSPLDKLVILAVLSSAAASTQTTILPTARTTLSMARWGAIPRVFGHVHRRHLTPHVSTLAMGVVSVIWYVGLTIASENVLSDSIGSIGLMIAFYYGFTGLACAFYYRRTLTRSVKNFFMVGVLPLAGGLMLAAIFGKSVYDLSKPANSASGNSWFGLGPPLVIAIGFAILGVLLMGWAWASGSDATFFRRRREVAAEPAVPVKH